MTTDTSEKGLEDLIVAAMTGSGRSVPQGYAATEPTALYGGTGWILGDWHDYDRDFAVDLVQLAAFIEATQPRVVEALDLDHDGPARRKFLARLQGEITKRGVIDVLRHGVKHGPLHLDLFYGTPTPGNAQAAERHAVNRFSVTRQLRYSREATQLRTQLALDLCLFINGLPVATFELKNSLTKQTVADAVEQYRRATVIRASCCSSSAAVLFTSRWTTARCASAPICRARRPGSCPSTGAGTTAPATRPTRTG